MEGEREKETERGGGGFASHSLHVYEGKRGDTRMGRESTIKRLYNHLVKSIISFRSFKIKMFTLSYLTINKS